MRRIALAAGGGCAVAIVLATLAARHASPAEVSPVVPRGDWSTVWVASLVAALVLYGVGSACALRSSRGRLGAAVALAVVVQAVPLAAPVLLSKDVFLYWSEGRTIAHYHQNPYRVAPAAHPGDPAFPRVSEEWRAAPPPYGPVFETVAAAPAAVAGSSAHRAELGFRVLAVLGILASIGLVAAATRNAAAVAFLGWNPLLALHFAGGGHNDAWMMALIVLAVVSRGTARAGAAWPLAAGFKALPAVLLPLELARTHGRAPRRFWVAFGATAVALVVAALAAYGTGWVKGSLVGAHITSPLGGVHWLTELGLRHRYAVMIGAAAFAAVYLALVREAWMHGRARLSLALTTLCLTTSLVRPWYALWPVALAAAEEDVPAALAAFGLTCYFLLGDAVSF